MYKLLSLLIISTVMTASARSNLMSRNNESSNVLKIGFKCSRNTWTLRDGDGLRWQGNSGPWRMALMGKRHTILAHIMTGALRHTYYWNLPERSLP